MIAVSGAAMTVIRGREVGTVGWPGGDTVETLQETGGGQTVLLWDGGAIVALIRQFLHRGAVQVARSQGHQSPHIILTSTKPAQAYYSRTSEQS